MPQRLLLLRIVLGLMCIVFAHLLGRSLAKKQQARKRGLRASSWTLRTLLAGGVLVWPYGIDWLAAVAYILAVASAVLAFYLQSRPKRVEEDLTRTMFPD